MQTTRSRYRPEGIARNESAIAAQIRAMAGIWNGPRVRFEGFSAWFFFSIQGGGVEMAHARQLCTLQVGVQVV